MTNTTTTNPTLERLERFDPTLERLERFDPHPRSDYSALLADGWVDTGSAQHPVCKCKHYRLLKRSEANMIASNVRENAAVRDLEKNMTAGKKMRRFCGLLD